MDILKELSENKTILLLIPSSNYNNVILDIAHQLSSKSLCYITLNKIQSALKELLKKEKVNTGNIIFIDAISGTIKATPEATKDCYFVASPGALTEMSLTVSKILSENIDYLIFDSLSNLLIFQSKTTAARFLSSTVNRIQESNTKAVFYALIIREHEDFIKECSMFVDKVIDLEKKEEGKEEEKEEAAK